MAFLRLLNDKPVRRPAAKVPAFLTEELDQELRTPFEATPEDMGFAAGVEDVPKYGQITSSLTPRENIGQKLIKGLKAFGAGAEMAAVSAPERLGGLIKEAGETGATQPRAVFANTLDMLAQHPLLVAQNTPLQIIKDKIKEEILKEPEEDYGVRADGQKKGKGYFGKLQRPDGKVSTELSVGVSFNGKETEIPTLVPTLKQEEIDYLIKGGEPTPEIVSKAVEHAKKRIAAGKSPFAEATEAIDPVSRQIAGMGDRLIKWNKKVVKEVFPEAALDPNASKMERFMYNLGSGATSLAGALGVTALTKNPAAAATLFGLYQKGDLYNLARSKGIDPKKAGELSTIGGALEGTLEGVGLNYFLKSYGGVAASALIRSGEQALQEALQQGAENFVVKMGGIDKARRWLDGVGESALIGGLLGAPASVIVSMSEKAGAMDQLKQAGVPDDMAKKLVGKVIEYQRNEIPKILQSDPEMAAAMSFKPIAMDIDEKGLRPSGLEKGEKLLLPKTDKTGVTQKAAPIFKPYWRIIDKDNSVRFVSSSEEQVKNLMGEGERIEYVDTLEKEKTKTARKKLPENKYSPLFNKWADTSVLQEQDGTAQVLYHGSDKEISDLEDRPMWLHGGDETDLDARDYATRKHQKAYYVKLKNPYEAKTREEIVDKPYEKKWVEKLKAKGYDGIAASTAS